MNLTKRNIKIAYQISHQLSATIKEDEQLAYHFHKLKDKLESEVSAINAGLTVINDTWIKPDPENKEKYKNTDPVRHLAQLNKYLGEEIEIKYDKILKFNDLDEAVKRIGQQYQEFILTLHTIGLLEIQSLLNDYSIDHQEVKELIY